MTPPSAPKIFDRAVLRSRRKRARAAGGGNFLLDHVAADLETRLGLVLRRFERAVDLGTPGDAVLRVLREQSHVGTVIGVSSHAPAMNAGCDVAADEEMLPFADGSLDLVVSALALHLVNDLPGTLAQIRRALKPDGLFMAAVAGGDTLTELRESFAEAESLVTGGASPRVVPFADVRQMGALLQRAGFALPVVDSEKLTIRYDTVFALMRDLRSMGATNMLSDRRRVPLRRETLTHLARIYADNFSDADCRVRATCEIIWLSGWAPHESQQKPLRPGSAQRSLADALRKSGPAE